MTDHRDPCAPGQPALPELGRLLPPALLLPAALLAALLLAADPVQAGPLADPTRPPAALAAPGGLAAAALPHQANRDTARALAAAARAAEPPPPAPPLVVQAVQLPARGPALALVDGRHVAVGDLIDGRRVLAIDAQGVLVQAQAHKTEKTEKSEKTDGAPGVPNVRKADTAPERLWLLGGAPKQTAGTIAQSQAARYVAAPEAADGPGSTPAPQAARATTPARDKPVAGLPVLGATAPAARSLPGGGDAALGTSTSTSTSASPSALPTPLSLAGRTAP